MANLLLIADDTATPRLLAGALKEEPERHEVAVAHSAKAGFDHLASHATDGFLLDGQARVQCPTAARGDAILDVFVSRARRPSPILVRSDA